MTKQKIFKRPVRTSIVLEHSFVKHLEREARYMSSREDKTISMCELIRRGLKEAFPVNESKDLFDHSPTQPF